MTTRSDIKKWFDRGVGMKATHLIVVCDTYSYEDFPVFVQSDENVQDKIANYSNPNNMLKVMEVYNLSKDRDTQLDEYRSYNL